MWKNLRVFISHNSAAFHWTFHFQILYWRLKNLPAKVLTSTCRSLKVCNYRRMWTLMVFKLWWFDIFDSLSLVQPIRFVPFPVGFWLAYWSVLYENIYGGSYGGKFLKKLVVLLSCKRDQNKIRNYMDRRVTPVRPVTSPTRGPPPPCNQALNVNNWVENEN